VRDIPETSLNIAGARAADLKGQWSWALFQWARDFGGSIIIVFIFAPYFTTSVIGDPIKGQALWGHLNAMAGVFTGLSGPLLGAIADTTGRRKPWLAVFVAVMSLTSILLWWCRPGGVGLGVTLSAAIVVLYTIAYNYSDIFQSSMLAIISPARRIGFLSGLGVALAQASTLLGLAILLYAFMLPGEVNWSLIPLRPLFGIDPAQYENSRISGPFSAIWLLIFSLPLFLFTPDGTRIRGVSAWGAITAGLRQLRDTASELRHYRNVAVFLGARICFNDAQVAIMIFSSIYAAGIFKWSALELTCYALILSAVSIGGSLLGGWLCDRFGAKPAIVAGISAAAVGLFLAISITPNSMFFFLHVDGAATTGLPIFRTVPGLVYMVISVATSTCVIAVFGTSRTMMARLAPIDKLSQFFGLYALSGSITAFLGPELVASFTALLHSQRAGMASLLLLLGVGLVGMCFVREERAVRG